MFFKDVQRCGVFRVGGGGVGNRNGFFQGWLVYLEGGGLLFLILKFICLSRFLGFLVCFILGEEVFVIFFFKLDFRIYLIFFFGRKIIYVNICIYFRLFLKNFLVSNFLGLNFFKEFLGRRCYCWLLGIL